MPTRLKTFLRAVTVTLLTGICGVAAAHHSFSAQYDAKAPIKVVGYVTKVEWTNPHVYIYIDVTDEASGEVSNWGFEMGPPHMLQRTGWKRNTLNIGDEIEIEGSRARDGSNTANARRVTRSDGEVLGAASSEQQTLGSRTGTNNGR